MASTQAFNQGNSSLLFYRLLYWRISADTDNIPIKSCIPSLRGACHREDSAVMHLHNFRFPLQDWSDRIFLMSTVMIVVVLFQLCLIICVVWLTDNLQMKCVFFPGGVTVTDDHAHVSTLGIVDSERQFDSPVTYRAPFKQGSHPCICARWWKAAGQKRSVFCQSDVWVNSLNDTALNETFVFFIWVYASGITHQFVSAVVTSKLYL